MRKGSLLRSNECPIDIPFEFCRRKQPRQTIVELRERQNLWDNGWTEGSGCSSDGVVLRQRSVAMRGIERREVASD
jgi:hypothetical protein